MVTFRDELKSRFAVLGLVVLVVLGSLLIRLWTMQVLQGEDFAALAEGNRIRAIPLDAPRGRVLDRNGRLLVTNRVAMAVTVAPAAIEDDDLLARLSTVIGVPVPEIEERLASEREAALRPRVVAIDVPFSTVAYLSERAEEYPGVEIEAIAVRDYPHGSLAAHLLGYTGEISESELKERDESGYELGDIVGKTGAERQFESVLRGDRGYRTLEVDARGIERRVIDDVEPVPGRDVRLTIDLDVQKVAEKALSDALKQARENGYRKARAGAVVALDVGTGEVLAMASAPSYEPSVFVGGISSADWKRLNDEKSEYPLHNRAITAAYPTASTFKAFTGLAALDAGTAGEWTTYDCQGTWYGMGRDWPKRCWNRSGHGTVSLRKGIEVSCDVVFYEIGHAFYRKDEEAVQEMARRFGYDGPTGIDLPGEAPGRIPDAAWKRAWNKDYPENARWLPGDTVNVSIGQGDLLATPLQVAVSYAAIANGGTLVTPRVLDAVLDPEGQPAIEAEPVSRRTVDVSKAHLDVMRRALRDVTTTGTGANAFQGFEVPVAGKTGTAEVARKDDFAWFVGYAPVDSPRYAVAVVVEQGGGGGSVAAPAARSVLGKLLGGSTERVRATDVSR